MKIVIPFLCLTLSLISCNQHYFEGEIIYDLEVIKKDSSFDLNSIPAAGSKISRCAFKNGDFIQWPDKGFVEYQYFNHTVNKVFYKVRGEDTLMFQKYDKRGPELDSILSITKQNNTDTILNKVCNRLVLQSKEIKLTFIYSPEQNFAINPDWYMNSEGGYYNIIYGHTKSIYLKFILETSKFISMGTAKEIVYKSIPDGTFPDITKLPQKELN